MEGWRPLSVFFKVLSVSFHHFVNNGFFHRVSCLSTSGTPLAFVDMNIMGTHGCKGIEKIFLGSVAERVVGKAPCPVMTFNPYCIPGTVPA